MVRVVYFNQHMHACAWSKSIKMLENQQKSTFFMCEQSLRDLGVTLNLVGSFEIYSFLTFLYEICGIWMSMLSLSLISIVLIPFLILLKYFLCGIENWGTPTNFFTLDC